MRLHRFVLVLLAASALPAAAAPPWLEFFTFSSINVVYVATGCVILGASAGMIGCFAFLRKRSLIGDALAHAALPGVCVAFMLTGTKNPFVILCGAVVSCWIGALAVDAIVRYTRCKEDSALGMVLSVFFGVGILLLTSIQKGGSAAQSGLDKFLFGQAAAIVRDDLVVIAGAGALLFCAVALGYKELKVLAFDPEFAAALGVPRRLGEVFLATLVVLAVAIGLQAVGVVLMAALLVTPPAAARYWTDRLSFMLVIAAVIGALSGFFGAYVSYLSPQMPTGPWMVVIVSTFFVISLAFAPERGFVSRFLRQARIRRRTAEENVLRSLYLLGERSHSHDRPVPAAELLQHRSMSLTRMDLTLLRLKRRADVAEREPGRYALTPSGVKKAERLTRLHRLWELYLTTRLELAPDHVHDDAEEIEHIITPEMEVRLLEVLRNPSADPHDRPIPSPETEARS